MKSFLNLFSLSFLFSWCSAEPLKEILVWDGAAPLETLTPQPGADPRGVVSAEGRRSDVFSPTFVPWPAAQPNSPVVIVCPGGGYNKLAEQHEGVAVAKRLNDLGCTALVLRYRVPRRSENTPWVQPLLDLRKTLEIARSRASEWNGDSKNIGVIGFSAGGNLAARLAYAPAEVNADRPDFVALIYPAYLFVKDEPTSVLREGLEGVIPTTGMKKLAPAFFAHSADDPYPAEASQKMGALLKSMGAKVEVHVWAGGGHGWGATDRCVASREWTRLMGLWMKDLSILTK
jgi:acetyl esterase/lipase